MRMNHLFASEPDVWLDQTPVIVPIQGEHSLTLTLTSNF